MDGAWGSWGHWRDCSATCGDGQQLRDRICDNPTPVFGGSLCASNQIFMLSITSDGKLKETGTQNCNDGNCPVPPDVPTTPEPTEPLPKGKLTISLHILFNNYMNFLRQI